MSMPISDAMQVPFSLALVVSVRGMIQAQSQHLNKIFLHSIFKYRQFFVYP